MHANRLRRVLRGVILTGTALSNAACCEVLTIGWAKSIPAESYTGAESPGVPLATLPRQSDGTFEDAVCERLCGEHVVRCFPASVMRFESPAAKTPVAIADSEGVLVCDYHVPFHCSTSMPSGRAPAGLERIDPVAESDTGRTLSQMAYMEAASVIAFRRLAVDLGRRGAPRSLVRAARRAVHDERRHARIARRLAARFDAAVPRVRATVQRGRSAVEWAIENAVEGCVRETFGALLALRQSTHASDPQVRRSMKRIAADELRHAALAWRLRRWFDSVLSESEREATNQALRTALADLVNLPPLVPSGAQAILGHPDGETTRALARAFADSVSGFLR